MLNRHLFASILLHTCYNRQTFIYFTCTGEFLIPATLLFQSNLDQERLKKQQELAAATALYQQLQQQQIFQLINR